MTRPARGGDARLPGHQPPDEIPSLLAGDWIFSSSTFRIRLDLISLAAYRHCAW